MNWIRLTADGDDLYVDADAVACVKTSMCHTNIWLRGASYFGVDQSVEEVIKRIDEAS